jgi:hypothetical protein
MPPAAIPEIHWFNTAYVIPEDRLRLSCTLKTGSTDVFWLTRRLANALAKNLVEWVDKSIEQDRFRELAHEMAQRSATAKRPKPPGTKIPQGPGWLVDTVGFKTDGKVLVLTFRDKEAEHQAFIRFDAEHLRRWLKVLHAQYKRGGWPADVWPDWITEVAAPKSDERPGLLH